MIGLGLKLFLLLTTSSFQDAVEVHLRDGKFVPASVHIPKGAKLKLVNSDRTAYTVEGAGALPGDVFVPPGESRTVALMPSPGKFFVIIEEIPTSELRLDMEGDPEALRLHRGNPFDMARKAGRQPLLFEPGQEPTYATYSGFDLAGKGESAQQAVLLELYLTQEALSGERPPAEFQLYFTPEDWSEFRQSVSMVVALGPGAYSSRFGSRIASCRPPELKPLAYASALKVKDVGQRDILVRIASDRQWFNQRAVRWVWRRLGKAVTRLTMEGGYTNPKGRSPLLGGFFDGTGNPYGPEREAAVFGKGNGTYLSWFRINFDEERFRSLPLAEQQKLIGRERGAGKPLKGAPQFAHMNRAGADPKTSILRQPFVFDDGPHETGLLFVSLQASPRALDRILHGFMLGAPRDRFLPYMRFESAALYYVPSSPRGSFPGSLRFGGR